ncbi:MFS transporter [Nitrososphaera sp.]|uniref:MFS transporter n=1 Tax=Nitrososphaera sp. TaxID=1971748 RepID=UPI00307ED956
MAGSEAVRELGEKMDSLARIPLRLSVTVAIGLASFFTYYDVTNYSYISPVLRNAWGISDADVAAGASLTVAGYVAGAVSITLLADSKGRKVAFITSILLLGVGSLLAAASQNIGQLVIFRFITGAGIGSELAIASVYIGEMTSRSKRGRYTSFLNVLGWAGLSSSGPVSLFLVSGQFAGIDGWRIVLGIAGIVALVSIPFRMRMPESPRWLLSKGRIAETNYVLSSIGLAPLRSSELQEGAKQKNRIPGRTVLLRIVFLSGVWLLVYIPIYASLLLVVEYVNQGYSIPQSILINILGGIGFVAGGLASVVMAERMERKYQIATASFVMSIGFVLRGLFVADFAGLTLAGFIAFFGNAWLVTSLLAYTAEIFPTRIRSFASGVVEGSGRALAAVAPFIFVALQPYGFFNLMIGMSAFSFAGAALIAAFGMQTRGRSLENLNREYA